MLRGPIDGSHHAKAEALPAFLYCNYGRSIQSSPWRSLARRLSAQQDIP